MNKIVTILCLIVGFTTAIKAQVGIGTNSPETSSALDISSSDKGFLMPRMTTAQREAIIGPVNGLMVFDSDTKSQWTFIDDSWFETKAGVGKFVDGVSSDIAYFEGRVGIGIDQFSQAHKLFVDGIKDTDATNTAVRINATYEGTGTSTATYGLGAVATNSSSSIVDRAVGTQGIVNNPNTGGTMNIAVGTWPQVNSAGTIGYAAGLISQVDNTGGLMTTIRGQDVVVYNRAGASMSQPSLASFFFSNEGTISGDGYGLFVGGGGAGSVGGNSYALYVATPFSNVTGNSYAIYSDNVNDSYVAGDLGVGTADPQQKVHVNGVMRLEPQDSPPTGDLGDLYVNSDGTLFFHNGTDWKAVQLAP